MGTHSNSQVYRSRQINDFIMMLKISALSLAGVALGHHFHWVGENDAVLAARQEFHEECQAYARACGTTYTMMGKHGALVATDTCAVWKNHCDEIRGCERMLLAGEAHGNSSSKKYGKGKGKKYGGRQGGDYKKYATKFQDK